MPFKLVAIVVNSLSLGHILSTDGVHVVSIDTIVENKTKEKINYVPKKRESKRIGSTKFHHPSGKTASTFVLEYMQQHKTVNWVDLKKFISEQGFHPSTVNNGIQRLLTMNQIRRISSGQYTVQIEKASD
jgi:hypothetical protein